MTWDARYQKYMASEQWAALSVRVRQRDGNRCRACGFGKTLEAHHHTYERFGHEHLDDLVTLCKRCHQIVHKLHNKQRFAKGPTVSLTEVTFAFMSHGSSDPYSQAVMRDHTPAVPPKPKRTDGKRVVSMNRSARKHGGGNQMTAAKLRDLPRRPGN